MLVDKITEALVQGESVLGVFLFFLGYWYYW